MATSALILPLAPQATIVITTRNRKDDLRCALVSAFAQSVPVEVIVTDDASDDGTREMVESEFPAAKVLRSDAPQGYIIQRNRAATAASTDFIFSIDDDAEFGSSDTVEKTLLEFSHPRIGAVAIPHVDTLTGRVVNPPAPADGKVWAVASYTGTAHALRRDLFLKLGGYREHLVHQGEEADYCIRLLASGHITRLGASALIQHHESPKRSFKRMDFYGRRNDVLFAWHNVPMPWLPCHLAGTTVNGLWSAVRAHHPLHMVRGILCGYVGCVLHWGLRSPVAAPVYRLHRRLKKCGPCTLESIEADLPRMAADMGAGAPVES